VAWLAAAAAGVLALSLGIRWWVSGDAGSASVVRLAVLPFEDLNHQQDRQYLADGLTEDTIAMIGRIDPERLMVIGRTSMMAYKGAKKSLAEIGAELNVDYLVESSLITEGTKLRVTSKLIRVRDEVQIWSAVYDKEPAGMLEVQRELSEAIAEQIQLRMSSGFAQAAKDRHSKNAEAYDEYLQARFFESQRNPATLALAITHYMRALEIDPNYALAWAGLAFTYGGGALNSDVDPSTLVAPMREAVENALRTGPNLSESQFVVGLMKWLFDWEWTGAETAMRAAIELDPGNASAHLTLGHMLSQKGRHGEAMSMMRIARDLEPFDPLNHALSSQVAFQKRDFNAAIEHAQRANRDGSGFWIGYMQLGQAYAETDKSELALEVLADAARRSDGNSKPTSLRGYIMARSGRTAEARDVLQILETRARTRYVPPYAYALVHAGLGEREAALEWLERAAATRDVHVIFLTVDPKWDPYRSDPRFRKILERCGFA
jgi:TolB-like protein